MRYDYVVIGGGHNGLIAANYLTRAGRSVVVLEQRPYLGGMAATQAHIKEAPSHWLSQGAIDSVFIRSTTIIEELSLVQNGLKLIDIDPSYGWINEDGETLCIFKNPEQTAQDIARFSKKDSATYLALQNAFARLLRLQGPLAEKDISDIGRLDIAKAVLQVAGDRSTRKLLSRLAASSAYEAISELFESDALRSLYAYWVEIACPSDVDGSAIYLASLAIIHQLGCSRPVGGMGGLIRALESGVSGSGGVIRLKEALNNPRRVESHVVDNA